MCTAYNGPLLLYVLLLTAMALTMIQKAINQLLQCQSKPDLQPSILRDWKNVRMDLPCAWQKAWRLYDNTHEECFSHKFVCSYLNGKGRKLREGVLCTWLQPCWLPPQSLRAQIFISWRFFEWSVVIKEERELQHCQLQFQTSMEKILQPPAIP